MKSSEQKIQCEQNSEDKRTLVASKLEKSGKNNIAKEENNNSESVERLLRTKNVDTNWITVATVHRCGTMY